MQHSYDDMSSSCRVVFERMALAPDSALLPKHAKLIVTAKIALS